MDPSKADRLRVPKSLRKLLDKSGLRYGIVIYSYGYVQTKKGYQKEKVEKAASKVIDKAIEGLTGISGLTNPSQNYSVSDPYGNVLYCAVVDGETDRVVHFVNETPTFSSHPGENANVSELLHKLLKEFVRQYLTSIDMKHFNLFCLLAACCLALAAVSCSKDNSGNRDNGGKQDDSVTSLKGTACIGPSRGPAQAKMAENACMGPENGPVRAPREIIDLALHRH